MDSIRPKRILLTEVAHRFVRHTVADAQRNGAPLLAIDATAGNGHDTTFLAQMLGSSGKVIAFDIQQQALRNTALRLQQYAAEVPPPAQSAAAICAATPTEASAPHAETPARLATDTLTQAVRPPAQSHRSPSPCLAGTQMAPVCLVEASHAQMAEYVPAQWRGKVCAILFNLGYLPGAYKGLVTRRESTLAALQAALPLLAPGGLLSVLCYRGHTEGLLETEAIREWCAAKLPQLGYSHTFTDAGEQAPAVAPLLLHVRYTRT